MTEIAQPVPLSTPASQAEPPIIRIFISYASEDRDIAVAVAEALKGALDENFAEINLDKWFMEAGIEFETQIRKKLGQTDIFIVIFTGTEKESHSFTGMEVGYFMRVMENRPGRMVPLFLKAAPVTMSSVQGIGIGFDSKVLNLLPEAFDAQNDVGLEDAMCKFVRGLQQRVDEARDSIGWRKVQLRPEQDAIVRIKTMRQKIFQILRKKAEISFRPQKQVSVHDNRYSVRQEHAGSTRGCQASARSVRQSDGHIRPARRGHDMGKLSEVDLAQRVLRVLARGDHQRHQLLVPRQSKRR